MLKNVDCLEIKGRIHAKQIRTGKVIREWKQDNLVTSAGKALAASRMTACTESELTHMAIGSSNNAPTESQTALQGTEHERVAVSTSITGNILKLSATFGVGIASTVPVGEFGIFNAASAGTMFSRVATTAFNMAADDTLEITWTLQFGE